MVLIGNFHLMTLDLRYLLSLILFNRLYPVLRFYKINQNLHIHLMDKPCRFIDKPKLYLDSLIFAKIDICLILNLQGESLVEFII